MATSMNKKKFVDEKVIESVITLLEKPEEMASVEQRWDSDYPAISDYMLQDSFALLKEEEQTFLKFIIGVIHLSWERVNGQLTPLDPKSVESIEEENWNKFHNTKTRKFRDKLNVFFNGYSQEDLLAFVEDSIEDDDEQLVTGAAREILFICAVTILDSIIQS